MAPTIPCLLLAVVLGSAPLPSGLVVTEPAVEAGADSEPIGVNVELIVDTLPKRAQAEVTAELERQLDADPRLTALERESATLLVRLEFNQSDPTGEVVLVHVVAIYQGEPVARENARACIQCTAAEMVEDALKILPLALAEVERRRAEVAAAEAQAEADAAAVKPPPPAEPPRSSTRLLGAAGYVAISSSVLGVGSSVAGLALLWHGEVVPTGSYLQPIDYRPPGRALVGVGLGMLVVGTVLLAVDLTVLRDRRRSKAQARLDGVSVGTMDGPGIVLSGRF